MFTKNIVEIKHQRIYDFAINFDNVVVENVRISDKLLTLCFKMNKLN